MLKDEQNCSFNGGGDAKPLKTWSEFSSIQYTKSKNCETFVYIYTKIFSSILCKQLFKIIKLHGVKYQFGSKPGVGCQDGIFTIKTLLHLHHTHNLSTWVLFSDLVKAFDTSNHVLIIKVLQRYGCPPNLQSVI